ncbi:hypothetical protein ACFZC5_08900 [Nocardia gamkensis]|uniref:hypothetical protein n=1 Tax=Nocardia gamkensis TaxID=352869 RepID=UPI0036E5692A
MSDGVRSFPRYITHDIELPLYHPCGESEVLKSAIDMGAVAIDRLADLVRPGTPENPNQAVRKSRREWRLDRLGDIAGNSNVYDRYARLVQKMEDVRASLIDTYIAVNGKEGEMKEFLGQALGRIEDSVISLNDTLRSAATGSGNRIPLQTEADLIDSIHATIGIALNEVRDAAVRMREAVSDIDWRSSQLQEI